MEIDTNSNSDFDLPNDHPTVRELTEEERGLYWSALEAFSEVGEAVTEYRKRHGEIDMEDPELKKNSEKIQTATALSEVLEETAAWRRNGIMADMNSSDNLHLGTEFDQTSSHLEDEEDE